MSQGLTCLLPDDVRDHFRGRELTGGRPNRRGRNVSVIGAVSLNGLLVQWSALGSIDGLTFKAFIAMAITPVMLPSPSIGHSLTRRRAAFELAPVV